MDIIASSEFRAQALQSEKPGWKLISIIYHLPLPLGK